MPQRLNKEEVLAKLEAGKTLRDLEIGDIIFQDHFFEYTPDFSGAIFTGITDFSGAQFSNGANFMSAKFSGNELANFYSAKFFGDWGVYFVGSQFSGENGVSFIFAEFSSEAGTHFNDATFSSRGKAEFNAAKFFGKGDNKFHRTKFFCEGGVDFSGAQFLGPGKTSFLKTVFEQHASAWFQGTKSDPPGTLEFVDVSTLRNALFLYSNLENVSLKNVRFRQTQNRFFNREYLADEVRNEIVTDGDTTVYNRDYYSQVEILYRQLKVNFENQRDYARAGDFHYGAMEMQRKWKMLDFEERPWIKRLPFFLKFKYITLTHLYRAFSGYGEKWRRALLSFIIVLAFCTGLNLLWVEPKTTPSESTRIEKWERDSLHRMGGTTLFTFKVLTLQRWEHDFRLKGSSYWPKFFVSVQHLVGPGIIALMLLAIRRKFRR